MNYVENLINHVLSEAKDLAGEGWRLLLQHVLSLAVLGVLGVLFSAVLLVVGVKYTVHLGKAMAKDWQDWSYERGVTAGLGITFLMLFDGGMLGWLIAGVCITVPEIFAPGYSALEQLAHLLGK